MKKANGLARGTRTLPPKEPRTIRTPRTGPTVQQAIDGFLLEKEAENLSPGSLGYYRLKLRYFLDYLEAQGVLSVGEIAQAHVTGYQLTAQKLVNPKGSGLHARMRAVKAFLRWCVEQDLIPDRVARVKMPKGPKVVTHGYDQEQLEAMLAAIRASSHPEVSPTRR